LPIKIRDQKTQKTRRFARSRPHRGRPGRNCRRSGLVPRLARRSRRQFRTQSYESSPLYDRRRQHRGAACPEIDRAPATATRSGAASLESVIINGAVQVARGCGLFGARGSADRGEVIQKLNHPPLPGPILGQVGGEPVERRAPVPASPVRYEWRRARAGSTGKTPGMPRYQAGYPRYRTRSGRGGTTS
jgi:hypothetical protein